MLFIMSFIYPAMAIVIEYLSFARRDWEILEHAQLGEKKMCKNLLFFRLDTMVVSSLADP